MQALAIGVVGAALLCCGDSGGASDPVIPPLSYLSLFPDRQVSVVGEQARLQVTARDLAGVDVPDVVPVYTSSDTSVVRIEYGGRVVSSGVGTATVHASAGGMTAEAIVHVGAATYDLATLGPPRILSAQYIDLSKIERVSRFRSTVGHSYTWGTAETCRSMKHYYQPKLSVDWTTVDIYAPASGTILQLAPDGAYGRRIRMRPRDVPALQIQIFHVTPDAAIVVDSWINAGDHLGRHASSGTMSDIAMGFGTVENGTLLSYFETMTDAVFAEYEGRGVASRAAAIITAAERDADPVPCVGEEQFTVHGTLPDWLILN